MGSRWYKVYQNTLTWQNFRIFRRPPWIVKTGLVTTSNAPTSRMGVEINAGLQPLMHAVLISISPQFFKATEDANLGSFSSVTLANVAFRHRDKIQRKYD